MNQRFTDTRTTVLDVIRDWARETGTPSTTVERIVEGLLPSIRLVRKKGGTKVIGGCRAGGLPDLPVGTAWPRGTGRAGPVPLSLVLQVNLAEVADFDPGNRLPHEGLLSLFYYWDDDGGTDEGRVVYFPGPLGKLQRVAVPDDLPEENRYTAYALEPRAEWTLSDNAALGLPADEEPELGAWFTLRDRVSAAQGLRREMTAHRLLGNPNLIQTSALDAGELLLLQAGPDYEDSSGMQWGDGGFLYLTLTEPELKAHQFERARLMLEMG